jgi:hypothetical protein
VSGKHGPIRFREYESIHDTTMRSFVDRGFVLEHDLEFSAIEGTGQIALGGRIRCQGDVAIDVRKILEVLGSGANALVKTVAYTYHVQIEDIGNLFRYDSAHVDHNTDHHVHRYDIFDGDRAGKVTLHGADGWPTLAEVIEEAHDWYYDNVDAIEALRGS